MRTVQLFLATALALLLAPASLMAAESDSSVAKVDTIIDEPYMVDDENRKDLVSVTSRLIEFTVEKVNLNAIRMPGKGWKDVCIMTFEELNLDLTKYMLVYAIREGTVSHARFRFDYIPFTMSSPTAQDVNTVCS